MLTDISTSAAPAALGELIRLLASMPDVRDMDVRNTARQVFALDEAAQAQGLALSNDEAREIVYGMPYSEWKAKHPNEKFPKFPA